ncbi:hypothetical protein JCM8547_000983 [Rhodosporidiobolus lusitaniae]
MSTSVSISDQPSRCTINNLPAELKKEIAELCAEQDERFRVWLENKAKTTSKAELKKEKSILGRSISSLYQVSKEWAELAAPYLFTVLKTTRLDLRYNCAIFPSKLAFFREFHLDRSDRQAGDILAALPLLHKVTKLVVKHYGLRCARGSSPYDSPDENGEFFATTAFECLIHLEEVIVAPNELSWLTRAIRGSSECLRSLDLTLDLQDEASLGQVITVAPQLQILRIATPAPLQQLSLSVQFLHSNHLEFAEKFSSTLVILSLGSTYRDLEDEFGGDSSLVADTATSAKPQHFPSLTHFEDGLRDSDGEWFPQASTWENLATFPHILAIKVIGKLPISLDIVEAAEGFCEDHGLRLEPPSSGPYRFPQEPPMTPAHVLKAEKLRTTLDYFDEQDGAELSRLETVVEKVEMERIAKEPWETM